MKLSPRRLGRYIKTVATGVVRRRHERRDSRQDDSVEYLAIHDGGTLNVCVDVTSGPVHLHLEGSDTVPLPESFVAGAQRVWVVDLLELDLPAGSYLLRATDRDGETHHMVAPPKVKLPPNEPMLDGRVIDLGAASAAVVLSDGEVRVAITEGDQRPRVVSLNYHGPRAFMIEAFPTATTMRMVATARETGDAVDVGGVDGGRGEMQVTSLYSQDSGVELRWDVALVDGSGRSHALYGPAVDYRRPDQATSYGDISFVQSGTQTRWKPYITRDGRLAVRVTAESREG